MKPIHRLLINGIATAITVTTLNCNASAARQLSLEESVDLIARYLTAWGDNIGGNLARSPQIIFGISGTNVYGGCIDSQGTIKIPGSYFCARTNTIVLEIQQLESLRRRHGDGAVVYAVAHEYGHWIQYFKGAKILFPQFELQADCLAGALISGASKEIGLETDDIPEMLNTAFAIGGGSHGTPSQRVWSLKRGLKSKSLNSCFEKTTKAISGAKKRNIPSPQKADLPDAPPKGSIPKTKRQDRIPTTPIPIKNEIAWIRPYRGNFREKNWSNQSLPRSIAGIKTKAGFADLHAWDITPIEGGFRGNFRIFNTKTLSRSPDANLEIRCGNFDSRNELKISSIKKINSLAATAAFYSICPTAKIPNNINIDRSYSLSNESRLPRNYEAAKHANIRQYDCKNQACKGDLILGITYARGKSYVITAKNVKPTMKNVNWKFTKGFEFDISISDQDTKISLMKSKARVACQEKNAWGDGLVSGYLPNSIRISDHEFWDLVARKSLCRSN